MNLATVPVDMKPNFIHAQIRSRWAKSPKQTPVTNYSQAIHG